MNARLRPRLILATKTVVAGSLVAYVFHRGGIDLARLGQALRDPLSLGLNVAILSLIVILHARRWRDLAEVHGMKPPVLRLSAAVLVSGIFGMLFAGGPAADVYKAWFAARDRPGQGGPAALTVLADRLLSAAVALLAAAAMLAFFPQWRKALPALSAGAWVVWSGAAFVVAFGILFGIVGRPGSALPLHLPFLGQAADICRRYRGNPANIAKAVLLTLAGLFATAVLFQAQATRLGIPLDLSRALFIVPTLAIVSYLALLPYGIGVAQVTLALLFPAIGAGTAQDGATLTTVLQTYSLLYHGVGGFLCYLTMRRFASTATSAEERKAA